MLFSNNPRSQRKQNIAGFLLLLFLLSGSLITNAQQKVQPGHTFKTGYKIRLVIANFNAAPRDTLFLLTIPPSVSAVLVGRDNRNVLSSRMELPVITLPCTNFNPVTTVEYSVSPSGKVELKAFDSSGNGVKILADSRYRKGSACPKLRAVILDAMFVD